MKTKVNLWSYRAHFFLEWEMFLTKCGETQSTYFKLNNFSENRAVYEIVSKNI